MPGAEEQAVWDTLRSREPASYGHAEPVRDLMRDLERG
jgi:hypothetical protein